MVPLLSWMTRLLLIVSLNLPSLEREREELIRQVAKTGFDFVVVVVAACPSSLAPCIHCSIRLLLISNSVLDRSGARGNERFMIPLFLRHTTRMSAIPIRSSSSIKRIVTIDTYRDTKQM